MNMSKYTKTDFLEIFNPRKHSTITEFEMGQKWFDNLKRVNENESNFFHVFYISNMDTGTNFMQMNFKMLLAHLT